MANQVLANISSTAITVEGTPLQVDGGKSVVSISATSYGVDGQVVLKGSPDGSVYTTLTDSDSPTCRSEYRGDSIVVVDKLGQGWFIRADFEITDGTGTGILVTLSTN